jgi:DUF4097 and DUF4098 domain-containing protein YvlB
MLLMLLLQTPSAHASEPIVQEARKEYRWQFPASASTVVVLPISVGSVRVITDAKDSVIIRATRVIRAKNKELAQKTLIETPITIDAKPDEVRLTDSIPETLRSDNRTEDAPEVELLLEVHTPQNIALSGSIGIGETHLTGSVASVNWQTGTGAIFGENLRVQKSLMLRTETGSIFFTGTLTSDEGQWITGAGGIQATISAAGSERIMLQTQVGEITASLKSLPKVRLEATTLVGAIALKVPSSLSGEASLSTKNGSIRTGFLLSHKPRAVGDTGGLFTGPIGKSVGVGITLQAGIGSVSLEKG